MAIVSQLNIRSEITRIRGVADQASARAGLGGDPGLIGPVPISQLLSNALSSIQDYANALGQQVKDIDTRASKVSASNGVVRFQALNMTVTVDQTANQLLFNVTYSDGTVKTGTVALV